MVQGVHRRGEVGEEQPSVEDPYNREGCIVAGWVKNFNRRGRMIQGLSGLDIGAVFPIVASLPSPSPPTSRSTPSHYGRLCVAYGWPGRLGRGGTVSRYGFRGSFNELFGRVPDSFSKRSCYHARHEIRNADFDVFSQSFQGNGYVGKAESMEHDNCHT